MLRRITVIFSQIAAMFLAVALGSCAYLGQHRAEHGAKPAPGLRAAAPSPVHPPARSKTHRRMPRDLRYSPHHRARYIPPPPGIAAPPPGPQRYTRITPAGLTYRVGTGDRLRIKVFGEPSLSADYAVDGSGDISMPLIATVPVAGRTTEEIRRLITAQLRRGFLRRPSVAVEVLTFRPFFILGEVNTPGKYPYVNGITVENAIAIAGGYTPRARKRTVRVTRPTAHGTERIKLKRHDLIQPGDTITVRERFF